ncbi:MAG: PepSY domain-containing protein [Clostridium sp.]|nr:PepSY domain-containing protein [Clostridium sp.]
MSQNSYRKGIVMCAVLAVLSGCASKTGQTGNGSGNYLTMEEVKAVVLENAGDSEEQVRFVRIHLDTDDGAAEYEVEFLCETAEYDYEVNARTGEILSVNFEIGDYNIAAVPDEILPPEMQSGVPDADMQAEVQPGADTQSGGTFEGTQQGDASGARSDGTSVDPQSGGGASDTQPGGAASEMQSGDGAPGTQPGGESSDTQPGGASAGTQQSAPSGNAQSGAAQYIGAEAAKQAALYHAGLNADGVRFLHAHLEWDDGCWIYDVEFHDNTTEYDYEIDAVSGAVLAYDCDAEYAHHDAHHGGNNAASGAQIGADDAKRIALEYAGVAETETQYLEVEYDYDDGRAEYEVQWYVGRTEYSCDVNAATGEILSFEKEVEK